MFEKSDLEFLTNSQMLALYWRCQGLDYKEIGEKLNISLNTVNFNLNDAYERLGLKELSKLDKKLTLTNQVKPVLEEMFKSPEEVDKWQQKRKWVDSSKVKSLRQEIYEPKREVKEGRKILEQETQKTEVPTSKKVIPPSLIPFIKEPTQGNQPEPIKPPPQPVRVPTRIPWIFISSICILGIVIFAGWNLLTKGEIFKSQTTPTRTISVWDINLSSHRTASTTPEFTNTPKPPTKTPTITPTPTITRTPTTTSTPVPLPFLDNFDNYKPAWNMIGEEPYIVNGELTSNGSTSMYIGNQGWKNYTISFKIIYWYGQPGKSAYVGIRTQSLNKMIAIQLSVGDCYGTVFIVDKDWTSMPNSAFYGSNIYWDWTTYIITASENHLEISVNGKKELDMYLPESVSTSFPDGGVVLHIEGGDRVDYFRINP